MAHRPDPGRIAVARTPLPSLTAELEDRPALVTETGAVWTHSELRARVERLTELLPDAGTGRRLVHLPLRAEAAHVAAYLATLAAGHAALVTTEDTRADAILARYRPDVIATGDQDEPFRITTPAAVHLLHPDLALLLSTSGSTGSPKLVRLSERNLLSNARAIATALRITAADRAITTLPLHYCFGLSVLHSHLIAGGSVVLHSGSVLDENLWEAVAGHRVSTLAVVPHTLDLMASGGVLDRAYPSLRLIAQAGGRLPPEVVARTVAKGREQSWDLAVMYGQTEATARICVLDPALVAANPDAVGRPIADTTLRLDTTVPEAGGGAGEVVVRGPGVMMGYAEHADDLALGSLLTELRTGDLGRIDANGLLRIVGRRSGFVKVMGLRVELAGVEQALEAAGLVACVSGDDAGLTILVEPAPGQACGATAARVRELAGSASGLGRASITVGVAALIRHENGKVDRPACAALALRESRAAPVPVSVPGPAVCPPTVGPPAVHPLAVRVGYALGEVLGDQAVDLDRSFVQLGGDSLSHVQASVRLEALLGALPRGWQHRPLRALLPTAGAVSAPSSDRSQQAAGGATGNRTHPRWSTVETSVLVRALAVVIICGTHAELFRFLGGAHTLLVVAGFNAARFGLSMPDIASRWRATGRTLIGIAVPTATVALVGMWTTDRYGWANALLVNWLFGTSHGYRNELWFIDTLAACVVVFAAVLSIPPLARWWRRDPWLLAILVAVLALIPRFVILTVADGVLRGIMPTTLWLFAAGAAVAYAESLRRRLITLGVAVVGGANFFPDDPQRTMTLLAGVALLALVPAVRLPRRCVPVLSLLAAASLHIYLVQFQVLPWVPNAFGATVVALLAGCLAWRVADRPVRRLKELIPLTPRPTGTPP